MARPKSMASFALKKLSDAVRLQTSSKEFPVRSEIISQRIKSLSQKDSDELVDSVLFVYHSLLNGGETA